MKIRCMGKLDFAGRIVNEISMRMSVNAGVSGYVFTLLVAALLFTGGAAAQGSCDAADALLKAQLYEDALANYTALLKQDPKLDCALKGIGELQRAQAINSYELGRAYENASQVKEARDAYIGALKKHPNYSLAQEALENVSDNKFAAVQTLANLGYYTEAADRLKKVIDENPGIEVPKDLEYLPGRNIPLWGGIRSWIEIWGQPVGEIAIFLLGILVGIYVLIYRISPWVKGFFVPSLDIQDFDKGATELEIGKGLKAMVEASYKQLVQEGSLHVNLVDGPTEKLAIPADVTVAPYFKFVSELIDWLFPPYVITLSGYLQKPGSLGSGITVALVVNRTKEILGSCTIWQKEFDLETTPQTAKESKDPTSYYNLAEPAAIWVLFQLGKMKKEGFKVLGTDKWLSLAYYRSGVHWHLKDMDKARQLYLEALNQDLNNYGALYNLGRLEFEDGHYEHACERLTLAQEATNSDKAGKLPEGFSRNPMWYLATYNLAVTYRYMSAMYKSNLSKAEEEIIALVETITKAADAIRRNDETVLKCDLSTAEEKAKTLLESIYEVIAELETAAYISHRAAGDETNQLIDTIKKKAKKLLDTLREAIISRQKNDNKELKSKLSEAEWLAGEIKEAIKQLQEKESAPFEFVKSQAEQEAKNLIETIKKAIDSLSTAEEQAKKLTDAIQEAIEAEQKKEDMKLECSLSKAKEQTKKLADKIEKAIEAGQENKDQALSKAKEQAEKLLKTIINAQQKNEDQALKDSLYKTREQANLLVNTVSNAIGRLNKNEKELKGFLEKFNPLAVIMCANTLLYISKKIDKINENEAGLMIKCIEPSRLNYRARYNLACYYSILGDKKKDDQRTKDYKDALRHLEYVLERGGGIVEWANKDLALKGVREDSETKEAFAKLIQKYSPQETSDSSDLPLAGLGIIRETYAKQLKDMGIVSHCDLVLKADTPSAQEELAKNLGISTTLLRRWALLADLMRIVGNTKYVNLLEAADYGSIEALKNVSDPCELAYLLNQVNKAQSLVKQLPSLETVQQWVQDARKTKPKVL